MKLLDFIKENDNKAITYRIDDQYLSITYNQLTKYMKSLAFNLRDYKDKTIVIIGNNKLEYVISLLSVICYIGDVFLIDKELSKEDILLIFENREPDLIILDDDIDLDFVDYPVILFSNINSLMRQDNEIFNEKYNGKLILHTSGTTGIPKCVELNSDNYLGVIEELNKKWEVNYNHSCLLIIPLYHIYALVCLFHGIYAGIENILEYNFKNLDKVLKETKPALFMGVPLMFNKIKDSFVNVGKMKLKLGIFISNILLKFRIDIRKKLFKEMHDYFGGNYVFGCSAGSLLPYKTNKFFNDIGLPVYNVYGMTETSGPIAINYKKRNKFASVGEILDINSVKIIDDNIYVKGSNVFGGYIKDLDKPYFIDDYFDTNDIGYIKDNYIYITGRRKDILIGDNGKNISSLELRNKILKNNNIHDCKIVINNNRLIAYLNTNLGYDEALNYVLNVNKGLPKYKQISKIEITDKSLK